MFLSSLLLPLAFSAIAVIAQTAPPAILSLHPPGTPLPTVDLGYGIYRASYYNESYDAYVFSNIRYARPPTGDLRFAAPQAPIPDRSKVHDGSTGAICHGALVGLPVLPPLYDAPADEDCLFLDVIVPRSVLSGGAGKVPVLFWIFGGAYTMGSKNTMGDPITFLRHSPSPVVYVGINYRVGHFGFLNGPTLAASAGTIPNAGLHDQLFALQWVRDNIHLFHGDAAEVTVMGVSAGGGSALHHVTAFGGKGPELLFKRVLPMSAGFTPRGGHASVEEEYLDFEAAVGCAGKGVSCIRAADAATLIKANKDIITGLTPPRSGPGPSVDGNYVPDLPQTLFAQGRFHKDITVLTTDDSDEGANYSNPASTLSAEDAITALYPHLSPSTLKVLLSFYPRASYASEVERFAAFFGDSTFDSNRYAVSAALPGRTYNMVNTGRHGDGTNNLFNDLPDGQLSVQVVAQMRRFVMNFVVTGDPNGEQGVAEGVVWPVYEGGRGLVVTEEGMQVVDVTARDAVWKWWAKGMLLS